jgi:hypothetical protein
MFNNSLPEKLHELRPIAARLQFVEERFELLVIEFYLCGRAAIPGSGASAD